jgi:hypothetical protein
VSTLSRLAVPAIFVGISILAGCLSRQEPTPQGFLLDYEGFEPAASGSGALVWRRTDFSIGDYDKVLLEPVQLFCGSNSSFEGIDPLELKRVARSFEDAVQRSLEDRYRFVDTMGPRVMRLRLAITDIEVARRPLRDAMHTISSGVGFHLSDVAMEGEILDSRSDERMAAFVDRRVSRQAEGETAFDFWAERLRMWMDEAHDK